MAGFRRKASTNRSTGANAASDHEWTLAQGEVNGKPLIARWDLAAKRGCPDASRPIKVTIGTSCAHPKRNGLPSDDDLTLFEAMEETLFAELPKVADSQPVLILTTNGMREWIVYASSHEWLEAWAPTFQQRYMKGRPGKVEAAMEPGWETFTEWTS